VLGGPPQDQSIRRNVVSASPRIIASERQDQDFRDSLAPSFQAPRRRKQGLVSTLPERVRADREGYGAMFLVIEAYWRSLEQPR